MFVRKVLLLLMSSPVYAAHCLIDVQPVAFGNYDIFYPAPLDVASNITVQCSSAEPFRITMDSGINGDGSFVFRRMAGGTGSTNLIYNLYLDASRQQIWGDGSGGSLIYSGNTSAASTQIPLYARIPPGQRVETGFYSDSVLVTVEW